MAIVFFVVFAIVERARVMPRSCRRTCSGTGLRGRVRRGPDDVGDLLLGVALPTPVLTKELGYSTVKSGAGLLPMMGVFAVTSFVAGSLYERLGAKLIVSLGAACLGVGIFMLSFVSGSGYGSLVPGMVVLGIGVGLFYSSITTSAVTALDPSRSSLAGGIVYMCQIAGGAVGLGLNPAIVASGREPRRRDLARFRVDAVLAAVGLVVAILFVGGTRPAATGHARPVHRFHRAHA